MLIETEKEPEIETPQEPPVPLAEKSARAKRAVSDLWGNVIAAKQNWQRVALMEAVALTVAVGGLIYLGSLPKSILYVVERDKSGTVSYAGPSQPADMDAATWNNVKIQALKQWLESWRTVTTDKTAQSNGWDRAFLFVGQGSQAKQFLDRWYEDNDPVQRANKGQLVSVRFKTFSVEGDRTFGLWWEETTTSQTGQPISTQTWHARLVYAMHIPSTDFARRENSLGLLITELSVEPVQ